MTDGAAKTEIETAKIGVVMASYNGAEYIEEQLASIWNQTKKPDEIIISDDGSSDATVQIIRSFAVQSGMPIQLCQGNQRHGYIGNFLYALEKSTADIIFLSDQDDVWNPEKIKTCLAYFNKSASILALSSGFDLIDGEGKNISRFQIIKQLFKSVNLNGHSGPASTGRSKEPKCVGLQSFLRHPHYPGMTLAFRRELADEILCEKNLKAAHDWQLAHAAAQKGGLYTIKQRLVAYRQHGDNTVGTLRGGAQTERESVCAAEKRAIMLAGIRASLSSMKDVSIEEEQYVKRLDIVLRERIELLRGKKMLRLLCYDLMHLYYVSFMSTLGDLYAAIKQ